MLIAIDAVAANSELRTGVGEYSFKLLTRMMSQTSSSEDVVLYTDRPLRNHWQTLPANWRNEVLRWSLPGWSAIRLNLQLLRNKPDVVFFSGSEVVFFSPSRRNKKRVTIATVHDVGFDRIPQSYNYSDRIRQRRSIKKVIKKCAHILAVSNFTKNELVQLYKLDPKRITVTSLGVERNELDNSAQIAVETLRGKYHLSQHYFLFVSRLDEKKNLRNLIQGFSVFKQSKGFGDPHQLVIVGPDGFGSGEIRAFAKESSARESIKILGAVSDDEKKMLYAGAIGYANVSWYEGFGLTPLEAASFGVPSILSDIPAHREVMGDSAFFVPPQDPQEIARAMRLFADDSYFRDALAKKAIERVGIFNWDETARLTWEVLRGALAPKNLLKVINPI